MNSPNEDVMIERIKEAFEAQPIPEVPDELLAMPQVQAANPKVGDWLFAKASVLVLAIAACLMAMVFLRGMDRGNNETSPIQPPEEKEASIPAQEKQTAVAEQTVQQTALFRFLTRFTDALETKEWPAGPLADDLVDALGPTYDPDSIRKSMALLELPTSISTCKYSGTDAGLPEWFSSPNHHVWIFDFQNLKLFDEVRGLVDSAVGDRVFDEVLEGIHKDINGPQIDVPEFFETALANRFFILDAPQESKQAPRDGWLVAFLAADQTSVRNTVDRAMRKEPDAVVLKIDDCTVYRIERNEGAEPNMDDFGAPPETVQVTKTPDIAVCSVDQLLVFGNFASVCNALKRRQASK